MAEAPEDLSKVIDDISDRVRRRILAARAGKEEPCTPSPRKDGPPPESKTESKPDGKAAECAPTCGDCPSFDACGTALGVRSGAARIAPDTVRTSADIAPYIDHTLLKPDATRDEVVKLAEEARKY